MRIFFWGHLVGLDLLLVSRLCGLEQKRNAEGKEIVVLLPSWIEQMDKQQRMKCKVSVHIHVVLTHLDNVCSLFMGTWNAFFVWDSCLQLLQHIWWFISGVIVYDYELKIGWGKSVALPSQALPAPPPGHMAIRNKEVASFVSFLCCIKFWFHLNFFSWYIASFNGKMTFLVLRTRVGFDSSFYIYRVVQLQSYFLVLAALLLHLLNHKPQSW